MINKILTPIILLLLVFNYSYCITNEKAECLYEERRELEGKTIFDNCEAAIFAATGAGVLGDKTFQDITIITCLLDYSVKFRCRNKSNTTPVIGENDWGRENE